MGHDQEDTMRTRLAIAGLALGALTTIGVGQLVTSVGATKPTIPFDDARLKIEYNPSDGDAGVQFFIDAEEWKHITVTNPRGRKVLDVGAGNVIRNYGLSELFSESSEPPFTEFPFDKFKQLFPEGVYTFRGQNISGERLQSTFVLKHTVPDGAKITSPAEGSTLPANGVTVQWEPVTTPAGIDIAAYEVIVIADDSGLGTAERTIDATLPPTATHMAVPPVFLTPGDYKVEVLAIERGGNQTTVQVAFTVA
jgi:hypothetical protein